MSIQCATCGGCEGCALTVELPTRARRIALAGNPNVGKTTIFNLLTGLHQKVGNYAGVTVERKVGRMAGSEKTEIIDLPGIYSLNPKSLDEEIAYRVLTGQMSGEQVPDLVVCVIDATNLERNLHLASQIMDLGIPIVLALNMMDAAERSGLYPDAEALSAEFGVPVVAMSASRMHGLPALRSVLLAPLPEVSKSKLNLPVEVSEAVNRLVPLLKAELPDGRAKGLSGEALRALVNDRILNTWTLQNPPFVQAVQEARQDLHSKGISYREAEWNARQDWLGSVVRRVVRRQSGLERRTATDYLDAVLTHRVAGPIFFLLVLFLIFQAVFTWAAPLMDGIEIAMLALGDGVQNALPEGMIRDLIVDGIIAGVGSVLVFLPQILLLFFFIGLLEDTGYMARAAFIADRMMSKLGLSGRSVVPLVSGYACAVPAIMATRTIDNHRDRLVTMMVIPLMSCSARLPIYTLFIGAFIPVGGLFGLFGYQGLALFGLYVLSTALALAAAWVLKRYLIPGSSSLLLLELPAYRLPQFRHVLWRMVERARMFVTKAGKIILFMSIVLWFLASFPRVPDQSSAVGDASVEVVAINPGGGMQTPGNESLSPEAQIRYSYVGRLGLALEPVMRPLGFDWKISASLITAFAAREVLVSTLATIYSVGEEDENNLLLHEQLRSDRYADTGEPVFTPLVAISLMIFVMLACQCMSTLAITRRETNSWRWPLFMLSYMTALAYLASLIVFQVGKALGLG